MKINRFSFIVYVIKVEILNDFYKNAKCVETLQKGTEFVNFYY